MKRDGPNKLSETIAADSFQVAMAMWDLVIFHSVLEEFLSVAAEQELMCTVAVDLHYLLSDWCVRSLGEALQGLVQWACSSQGEANSTCTPRQPVRNQTNLFQGIQVLSFLMGTFFN
jgi:hypothetical protein